MTTKATKAPGAKTAMFCIWSILYQDLIVARFKIYIILATLFILFLNLAGKIGTAVAFGGLSVGGIAVAVLMWSLIRARKKTLLSIEDPELREIAHEAMLVYLSRKHLSKRQKRFIMRRLHNSACLFKEF